MSLAESYKKFINQKNTEAHMQQSIGVSHFNKPISRLTNNQNSSMSVRLFGEATSYSNQYTQIVNEINIIENEIQQLEITASKLESQIKDETASNLSFQMMSTFKIISRDDYPKDDHLTRLLEEHDSLKTYIESLVSLFSPQELDVLRQEIKLQIDLIDNLSDYCANIQKDIDATNERSAAMLSLPIYAQIAEQREKIDYLHQKVNNAVQEHRRLKAEMIEVMASEPKKVDSELEQLQNLYLEKKKNLEKRKKKYQEIEVDQQNDLDEFIQVLQNKKERNNEDKPSSESNIVQTRSIPKEDTIDAIHSIEENQQDHQKLTTTEELNIISENSDIHYVPQDARRSIKIGYFDSKISKKVLMPHLVQFGTVENYSIEKDLKPRINTSNQRIRNTGNSQPLERFYVIAKFKKHHAAKKAIQKLNGKKLRGNKLYLDWYENEIVESGSELKIEDLDTLKSEDIINIAQSVPMSRCETQEEIQIYNSSINLPILVHNNTPVLSSDSDSSVSEEEKINLLRASREASDNHEKRETNLFFDEANSDDEPKKELSETSSSLEQDSDSSKLPQSVNQQDKLNDSPKENMNLVPRSLPNDDDEINKAVKNIDSDKNMKTDHNVKSGDNIKNDDEKNEIVNDSTKNDDKNKIVNDTIKNDGKNEIVNDTTKNDEENEIINDTTKNDVKKEPIKRRRLSPRRNPSEFMDVGTQIEEEVLNIYQQIDKEIQTMTPEDSTSIMAATSYSSSFASSSLTSENLFDSNTKSRQNRKNRHISPSQKPISLSKDDKISPQDSTPPIHSQKLTKNITSSSSSSQASSHPNNSIQNQENNIEQRNLNMTDHMNSDKSHSSHKNSGSDILNKKLNNLTDQNLNNVDEKMSISEANESAKASQNTVAIQDNTSNGNNISNYNQVKSASSKDSFSLSTSSSSSKSKHIIKEVPLDADNNKPDTQIPSTNDLNSISLSSGNEKSKNSEKHDENNNILNSEHISPKIGIRNLTNDPLTSPSNNKSETAKDPSQENNLEQPGALSNIAQDKTQSLMADSPQPTDNSNQRQLLVNELNGNIKNDPSPDENHETPGMLSSIAQNMIGSLTANENIPSNELGQNMTQSDKNPAAAPELNENIPITQKHSPSSSGSIQFGDGLNSDHPVETPNQENLQPHSSSSIPDLASSTSHNINKMEIDHNDNIIQKQVSGKSISENDTDSEVLQQQLLAAMNESQNSSRSASKKSHDSNGAQENGSPRSTASLNSAKQDQNNNEQKDINPIENVNQNIEDISVMQDKVPDQTRSAQLLNLEKDELLSSIPDINEISSKVMESNKNEIENDAQSVKSDQANNESTHPIENDQNANDNRNENNSDNENEIKSVNGHESMDDDIPPVNNNELNHDVEKENLLQTNTNEDESRHSLSQDGDNQIQQETTPNNNEDIPILATENQTPEIDQNKDENTLEDKNQQDKATENKDEIKMNSARSAPMLMLFQKQQQKDQSKDLISFPAYQPGPLHTETQKPDNPTLPPKHISLTNPDANGSDSSANLFSGSESGEDMQVIPTLPPPMPAISKSQLLPELQPIQVSSSKKAENDKNDSDSDNFFN